MFKSVLIAFALFPLLLVSQDAQPLRYVSIKTGVSSALMKPLEHPKVKGFDKNLLGFHLGISREAYFSKSLSFGIADFQYTFMSPAYDSGTCFINRFDFGVGMGNLHKRYKWSFVAGPSFVKLQYQRNGSDSIFYNSFVENRIGLSMALNLELVIRRTETGYLGLLVQPLVMLARPAVAVHQLSVGIKWQPDINWWWRLMYKKDRV